MDFLVLRCGMSAEAVEQARLIQKTNQIQDSHQWAADRSSIFEEKRR